MSRRKDSGYRDTVVETLEDILEFAGQAQRLVAHGREEYENDEILRLASEAVIHRIGEAVKRLPDDFTEGHPEIAWRAMRGTRNIVSHNYDAIDHKIVWKALSDNLPKDAARIRAILCGNGLGGGKGPGGDHAEG